MKKSDTLWAERGIAGLCLLMPQLVWSESRVMRRLMSVRQTTARPVWSIWCLCQLVRLSSNWKSQRPSVVSLQPGGGLLISQVNTCSLAVNHGSWISVGANYVTCKLKICLYICSLGLCLCARQESKSVSGGAKRRSATCLSMKTSSSWKSETSLRS